MCGAFHVDSTRRVPTFHCVADTECEVFITVDEARERTPRSPQQAPLSWRSQVNSMEQREPTQEPVDHLYDLADVRILTTHPQVRVGVRTFVVRAADLHAVAML